MYVCICMLSLQTENGDKTEQTKHMTDKTDKS